MTSLCLLVFISKYLQPISHHKERIFIKQFTLSSLNALQNQKVASCSTKRKAIIDQADMEIYLGVRIFKQHFFLYTKFSVMCAQLYGSCLGDISFLQMRKVRF